MSRIAVLSVVLAFASACGGSGALLGVASYNVTISPSVPQHDSVSFSIANSGSTSAFVEPCGDYPHIRLQVRQGNQWVAYGPLLLCALPTVPGPIELSAGAELLLSTLIADPGRYRVGVSVATSATMADAQMAYSAAFVIQ